MAEPPSQPKTDLRSLRGYYLPPADLDPRPPYQLRGCTCLYVSGALTPEMVSLLPPSLHPFPTATLSLFILHAPEGWGLAPFTALFLGLDVEGHDSGDGAPGVFLTTAIYSGRAAQVMPRDYSPQFRAGNVELSVKGNLVRARADLDDQGASISLQTVAKDQSPARHDGMNNYLAVGHDGGLIHYTNTHSLWATETRDLVIEANLPKGHRLSFLNHIQVEWSVLMTDLAFTQGAPHPVAGAYTDDGARLAFLDVLSQLGRPIAIVEQSGRIAFMTSEAQALLRDDLGATVQRLPSASGGSSARASSEPALLTLASGRQLAARAFPIALRLGRGPLSLVLLTDPREPGPTDPEPLFRLMGLTPSEAALAALVGGGLTPAEAARSRGITEATARSTLKTIFQKLNIRRQVDLAQIVARLQGV